MDQNPQLEERIAEWRSSLSRYKTVQSSDIEELEDHLRSQYEELCDLGLHDDEAFLVAVKRLGSLNSVANEFAQEYSERLWKQLLVTRSPLDSSTAEKRESTVAILVAIASGIALKVPELFGYRIWEDEAIPFYFRNFFLFIFPFLTAYFIWKRNVGIVKGLWLAIPLAGSALVMNFYPFIEEGSTFFLSVMHLPIALWVTGGLAYISFRWNDHGQRMNFVRFSGEWFIYYALIALGGMVLVFFIMFIFDSIGLSASTFVTSWVIPMGIIGAVIISAWLVEAKQNIIENMAPVLTRIFTPLFTLVLLSFLVTMVFTGRGINVEREVLIGYDLLLVLVLALILFTISVRDPELPPGLFDWLQLVLLVSALLVDLLALIAISARISEFGFSPNKVAALGENIILLVNLGWSAFLYSRFLMKRTGFTPIERWQTAYIPVYGIWAWIVVVIFPLVFSFK